MSIAGEIDLETGRIFFDGAWQGGDELTQKLTQAIAVRNFEGVGRLGESLEKLTRTVADAKVLTVHLPGDTYARLEGAARALGQSTSRYVHDWLVQGSASLPLPPVAIAAVTEEEAASALTLAPKRRESV